MDSLTDLADSWRDDAERLRRYGDDRGADIVDGLAAELEDAIEDVNRELLTLGQASDVSGYSKRRLRGLVNEGKLENRGEKGRPRFARADLPRKPSKDRERAGNGSYDPSKDAQSIAGRIGGNAA